MNSSVRDTFLYKMFRLSSWLFLVFSIFNVECKSSLTILQAPKGIHFQNDHTLLMSKVKDVLEAVLSYTVEAGYDWRGVEIKNPFTASAECLLLFHLRGPNELNFPFKTTLPLEEDDDVSHIFDDISRDTLLRYPDELQVGESPNLEFKIISNPNSSLSDEVKNLKDIVSQMITKKNKDGVPDIYWITLSKLAEQPLMDDDINILSSILNELAEKVSKIYNEKAFIAVIMDDQLYKIRSKRETTDDGNVTSADLNLADDYSEDFPVIFNIILWFSLALLFSLIAISMVIAGMDPGRDSIIYRMTSTRMKKDN